MEITDVKYVRHRKGGENVVYQLSDTDMAGSSKYYLYTNNEGGWLIMEEADAGSSLTTYRYKVGWSDPLAAWTARAGGGYVHWHLLGEKI